MVRSFVPDDQAAVRALILEGMRERWAERYDPTVNADLDDIAGSYVACGSEVVVDEIGGRVVAVGILLREPDGHGLIVRMSVAATRRRCGHGRGVVAELLRRARHRGMREVRVLTDTPWASAVAFYASCGFVEVARDDVDTHFAMELAPRSGGAR